MTHHKYRVTALILCTVLLSCSEPTEERLENGVDQLERRLELRHHEALLTRMAADDSKLAEFTTDGCSGGLSIGWVYLAGQYEVVREYHGNRPPWEDCCIAHDRLYHTAVPVDASAEQSFEARKQADAELHDCVIETALERATALSNEYEVSVETVQSLYTTIADLMYRAVRVGGIPCSGLPWRWGYGWPECE